MRPRYDIALALLALVSCSSPPQGPVGSSSGASANGSGGLVLGDTGPGFGGSGASSTGAGPTGTASGGETGGASTAGGSSTAGSSSAGSSTGGGSSAGSSSASGGGVSTAGGGSSGGGSSGSSSGGGSTTGAANPCGPANFTVACGSGDCPANSSCGSGTSCGCNAGTVAVYCDGRLCDSGCSYGLWWCAPLQPGACGPQNFDIPCVSDGGSYDCPSNSHCASGGCACNGGYWATNCSGALCSSSTPCGYPNWWCTTLDGG